MLNVMFEQLFLVIKTPRSANLFRSALMLGHDLGIPLAATHSQDPQREPNRREDEPADWMLFEQVNYLTQRDAKRLDYARAAAYESI
jgi:hypothetical protein